MKLSVPRKVPASAASGVVRFMLREVNGVESEISHRKCIQVSVSG